MTESEFNDNIDDTLIAIEEAIEESGANIDFQTSAGILTLSFENNSKIIINRQTPLRQLWVAAKAGGYHLNYDADDGTWKNAADSEELFSLLSRLCSEQASRTVTL